MSTDNTARDQLIDRDELPRRIADEAVRQWQATRALRLDAGQVPGDPAGDDEAASRWAELLRMMTASAEHVLLGAIIADDGPPGDRPTSRAMEHEGRIFLVNFGPDRTAAGELRARLVVVAGDRVERLGAFADLAGGTP